MTRPIDFSKLGMCYAHAQKNFGPSGITIALIREDLIGRAPEFCPSICNY